MVGIRPLSLAFLMLALLLPASASAEEPTARIIIMREAGLTPAEQRDIRADVDATLVERTSVPRMDVVEVPRSEVDSALGQLRSNPDVEEVARDRIVHELAAAPDPQLDQLWGFRNFGQAVLRYDAAHEAWVGYNGDPGADMKVTSAWDVSLKENLHLGLGHTIAIVDGGVRASHDDLTGRVAPGYDWPDEDTNADDPRGHGTHVAGTAAATRENGLGAAGVAPEARVLPLRVLNAQGAGRLSDIIEAFHFAGQQGIRVVNASFGMTGSEPLLLNEIADHQNTLFVTAAGNSGVDATNATFPCSYPLDNILCVGATDATDAKPDWSNYGAQSVDVYAPGEGIYSTWNTGDDKYATTSGTSTAAPHIAGLAALLLSRNPSLSTAQLKDIIVGSADQPAALAPYGKRANADAALGSVPADRDGDGVTDDVDNCVDVKNPGQDDAACGPDAPAPDSDADGVADDQSDACPYEPGTAAGCPGVAADVNHDGVPDMFDADKDAKTDSRDNCPTVANPDQANLDRDAYGDRCDPDVDADGVLNGSDGCPRVYARTANGCPAPVVTPKPVDADGDGRVGAADACPTEPAATLNGCPLPAVTALSATSRKRRATVTVRTSRAATVLVTVQRKRGGRWVRVTGKTLHAPANLATMRTKRLRPGRYRVVVVLTSGAGRTQAKTKRFRVR